MKLQFNRMQPNAHRALVRMLLDAAKSATINGLYNAGTVALDSDLTPVQRVQDARWMITYCGDFGPVTVVQINADGTMVHIVKGDVA
jgi:hypothetical protein